MDAGRGFPIAQFLPYRQRPLSLPSRIALLVDQLSARTLGGEHAAGLARALAALGLPMTSGLQALAHAQEHDISVEVRAEARKALAEVTARDGGMTAPDDARAR